MFVVGISKEEKMIEDINEWENMKDAAKSKLDNIAEEIIQNDIILNSVIQKIVDIDSDAASIVKNAIISLIKDNYVLENNLEKERKFVKKLSIKCQCGCEMRIVGHAYWKCQNCKNKITIMEGKE